MLVVLVYSGVLLLGVFVNGENCREGERTVLKGTSCTAFEECIDEEIYVKQCIPGDVFDSISLKCKRRSEVNCEDLSTSCDETKLYPRPDSCKIYEKCEKGRIVTKFCPIGEIFDSKINSCKRGLKCENCAEGQIKAHNSCNAFNICLNGKWRVRYCLPFFKFNPELNKCVWYTQYNCTNEEPRENSECTNYDIQVINCREYRKCVGSKWITHSCALGEFFDEESMMCKVGSCNKRSKRDVSKCVNGHRRRVEGECRKYFECINNEEVVKSCPDCLNFDDETRECIFVSKKPCPYPAPPVPTDATIPPTTVITDAPEPTAYSTESNSTSPVGTTAVPTRPEPTSPEATTAVPTSPVASSATPEQLETTTESKIPSSNQSNLTAGCRDGDRAPILGDCKHYVECQNGTFIQMSCGWFQDFDSVTKECRYFSYTCAQ